VKIRRAAPEDVESILRLERAAASAPHWNQAVYADAVEDAEGRCILVADEDGICGFAVGSLVADEAELESVAVMATRRRQGVGRSLCQAVVACAIDAGAKAVSLEVRASSAAAIGLYRSLGFECVGLRKAYYAAPIDDAVILRLSLENPPGEDSSGFFPG
jgi:ribosomal-protein-alanine N-acetyltransferase